MLVPNTGQLTKALDNVGNPDFKLSPSSPSKPADIAHSIIMTTPDLTTLAAADQEFILQNGSTDDATKLFAAIKGTTETIPALIVESSPQVLKVAVSDDAIRTRTADFTVKMTPHDLGLEIGRAHV